MTRRRLNAAQVCLTAFLLTAAPAGAAPPTNLVAANDDAAIENMITSNFTGSTTLGWATGATASWSNGLTWQTQGGNDYLQQMSIS